MGLKVTLVRHGQTDWNVEHRVMGRLDIPLNPKGESQAQHLSQILQDQGIDHIFSSPQLRAIQTVQPVSIVKKVPIEIEDRLAELRFDRWQGKVLDEIKNDLVYKLRRQDAKDFDFEDVESITSLMERTQSLLSSWQKLQGHLLCVSHMDVLKALILQIEGKPREMFMSFEVDHVTPLTYVLENGQWYRT